MAGLVLKLGPKERVLINGAVIENGDRRSKINVLSADVNILRMKDALHPDDVCSPVTRVCYILQLILSGDTDPKDAKLQVLRGIEQLSRVFRDSDSCRILANATDCVIADRFYPGLKALRGLIAREARLMAASEL